MKLGNKGVLFNVVLPLSFAFAVCLTVSVPVVLYYTTGIPKVRKIPNLHLEHCMLCTYI